MKWRAEADAAIRKVPFFVRKRVRSRVESYVAESGRSEVSLDDVHTVKRRYMQNMEKEIKGYQIDACFGPSGCPNRAGPDDNLADRLERLIADKQLLAFLQESVNGPLKFHHEFRITLADCPNACSQPQIKDIGIIGAAEPEISDAGCSMCGECVDLCREEAIQLDEALQMPKIHWEKCLMCGQCADACPTGTLRIRQRGYQVLIGGKLGRHPRLARPLDGHYNTDGVLEIVSRCIDFYKQHSRGGTRFAELAEKRRDELMRALAEGLDQYRLQ